MWVIGSGVGKCGCVRLRSSLSARTGSWWVSCEGGGNTHTHNLGKRSEGLRANCNNTTLPSASF